MFINFVLFKLFIIVIKKPPIHFSISKSLMLQNNSKDNCFELKINRYKYKNIITISKDDLKF